LGRLGCGTKPSSNKRDSRGMAEGVKKDSVGNAIHMQSGEVEVRGEKIWSSCHLLGWGLERALQQGLIRVATIREGPDDCVSAQNRVGVASRPPLNNSAQRVSHSLSEQSGG